MFVFVKTGVQDLQDQTRHRAHIPTGTNRAPKLLFQVNMFARQKNKTNKNPAKKADRFQHKILDITYISRKTSSH